MLMDEPFGAVDPIVRDRLQNEFLRLQDGLAKTILFVTHDIDEAIKMGDLVAVMEAGGKLAQFGPPADILANPASDFVARFVGADRGLKRLSLVRVGDLGPVPASPPVRATDAAEAQRRLADDAIAVPAPRRRGRIGRSAGSTRTTCPRSVPLPTTWPIPMSPLLEPETTLKDALSMLLEADVQAGIVVDPAGRVVGLITVDAIVG